MDSIPILIVTMSSHELMIIFSLTSKTLLAGSEPQAHSRVKNWEFQVQNRYARILKFTEKEW